MEGRGVGLSTLPDVGILGMDHARNEQIASRMLPVDIVLHPSWWHRHEGLVFDEDFFFHPARRVEAERRAALEATAKAEKAKVVVDAQAEAEKRRIEAEGEASAIFAKLEAEAKGQYEIMAKKAEGLRLIVDACDDGFIAMFGLPGADPARYTEDQTLIEEVWAVDVNGLIVVLDATYYAETPQTVVDELRAMLASATFETQ